MVPTSGGSEAGATSTPKQAVLVLAFAAALLGATAWRLVPPTPREGAPAAEFSALRALSVLERIAGSGRPRPTGSAESARVREVLLERLRALGIPASTQEAFGCTRFGTCGRMVNVVARIDGAGPPGKAVLLVSHYDTVRAGPGAADAGACAAAVLEVARALKEGPPPSRAVILLIDDGEELGLAGAQVFLDSHPLAREVGAIVNLEARGTAGPSLLFQTAGPSAFVAGVAARNVPAPASSSLLAAIYERMPNDTDLTVLRELGVPGANLAFIGEPTRYHTPIDDVAHLDPRSLQHQGENALALVRGFAAAPELEAPPAGGAVWFDVLGGAIVRWPERASLPLALAAAALLLAAALRERRRAGRVAAPALLGLAAFLAAPLAAALCAQLLRSALAAAGALPRPWVAHPGPFLIACWLLGIAAAVLAGALLGRRAGAAGLRLGAGLGWCLAALGLAVGFPGGSHVAIVPALAAGATCLAATALTERASAWLAALNAVAAGLVLYSTALLLPEGLGTYSAPLLALVAALCAAPLAPLFAGSARQARWIFAGGPAAAALALAAATLVLPHASPERPQIMSLVYLHDLDAGSTRWLAMPQDAKVPAALRQAAPFGERSENFPWMYLPAFAAPAPAAGLAPPELRILETRAAGGSRELRALLRSPRGAPDLLLLLPPAAVVESAELGGRPLRISKRVARMLRGHQLIRSVTTPPEGLELKLTLEGESPVEAILLDQSGGLPAGGEALTAARPPTAVTVQDGDTTVVMRKVRL